MTIQPIRPNVHPQSQTPSERARKAYEEVQKFSRDACLDALLKGADTACTFDEVATLHLPAGVCDRLRRLADHIAKELTTIRTIMERAS